MGLKHLMFFLIRPWQNVFAYHGFSGFLALIGNVVRLTTKLL